MTESTLSKQAYHWILERLLNGELQPGDALYRREIAEKLKISVAPVLEAFIQLEMEGFLETVPRQGTRVCRITKKQVKDYLTLREALETQAARIYCDKPIREARDELESMARQTEKSIPNSIQRWRNEIAFHKKLISLSNSMVMMREFDYVMKHNLFYANSKLLPHNPEQPLPEADHLLLLDDLETDDPDKAAEAIRRHLRRRL